MPILSRPLQRAFEPIVRRCQRSCLFVVRSREIEASLLLVKPATVDVDVAVVRPQLEGLRIFRKRLLWAVHAAECVATPDMSARKGPIPVADQYPTPFFQPVGTRRLDPWR